MDSVAVGEAAVRRANAIPNKTFHPLNILRALLRDAPAQSQKILLLAAIRR